MTVTAAPEGGGLFEANLMVCHSKEYMHLKGPVKAAGLYGTSGWRLPQTAYKRLLPYQLLPAGQAHRQQDVP